MDNPPNPNETELIRALNAARQNWEQVKAIIGRLFKAQPAGMPDSIRRTIRELSRALDQTDNEAQRTVKHLGVLQDVIEKTAMISSTLELDQVLERVMDTVIELTNAERGYLMLHDDKTRELKTRIARDWDQESLKQEDVLVSQSIINEALAQGAPVFTTNAQYDDRFQQAASVVLHNLRSILCIPMLFQGRTIGVIYAESRMREGMFYEDAPMLSAFATQISIAINNARAFQHVMGDLEQARKEVMELRIQIDEKRQHRQVSEITESEYFQRLQRMKDELRERLKKDE